MIDILINSCARPSLLEASLLSFKTSLLPSNTEFRWVLIEDYVEDKIRRENGLYWLYQHQDWFDDIILLDKKAGVGYWWQETMKHCTSDYHIHLEDDNEYRTDLDLDKVLEVMYNNEDIVEIIFSRTNKIPEAHNPREVVIDGLKLTEIDSFSVAAGVFNTKHVYTMLDSLGWENKIHEAGTLTPKSKELGFRKFVLGHNIQHYEHIGAAKKYRKGKYE